MARVVVPLTPTSSPRPWWLVSAGGSSAQAKGPALDRVDPRPELVASTLLFPGSPVTPGALGFHFSQFLFLSLRAAGRTDGAGVTRGPEWGEGGV